MHRCCRECIKARGGHTHNWVTLWVAVIFLWFPAWFWIHPSMFWWLTVVLSFWSQQITQCTWVKTWIIHSWRSDVGFKGIVHWKMKIHYQNWRCWWTHDVNARAVHALRLKWVRFSGVSVRTRTCHWGGYQRIFRLKTRCKWRCFELNMNACTYGHLDDTTRALWRHVVFFFCCFIKSEKGVLLTSIVLDLAATLFTTETPKVLCGLKHFTQSSISIVVSR